MTDDMEEIEMVFDDSQARFRMGEIEVTSKLLDSTYPDYRPILGQSLDIEFTVDKTELLRVTKMAAIFSQGNIRAVICEIDKEKKTLAISSVASEVGENRSEIEIGEVAEGARVKVDARYLTTAINTIDSGIVRVGINKNSSQMLLRNEKKDDYRHMVMPLLLD